MTPQIPLFVFVGLLALGPSVAAQESKPLAQPAPAAKVYDVPKDGLVISGKLTKDDPPLAGTPVAELNGAPHQVFQVKLQKGQSYVIDLVSKDFDAYLILQNAIGKVLAHDDDSGGGLNSRIAYVAKTDAVYRIVTTALDRKEGAFQLKVRTGGLTIEQQRALEAAKLDDEGIQLYQSRRFAAALEKMQKAFAIRQKLYPAVNHPDGHADLAESLHNLGFVLQALGRYDQAAARCEEAFAMYGRLYPQSNNQDGHIMVARSRNNLAFALMSLGRLEQAQSHFEASIAMYARLFPIAKHPAGNSELATGITNLGEVFLTMGKTDEALARFEQARSMHQRLYPASNYPSGHPDLATGLTNVGTALYHQGRYADALVRYEEAYAMRQKLYPAARFPDGHPEIGLSLNNLGVTLRETGQHELARRRLEKALEVYERLYSESKFPNGHPDLARALNNLGYLLNSTDRADLALPHYEQALAMRQRLYPKKTFPDGHPLVAQALNNVAAVLLKLERHDQARERLDETIVIYHRLYPPDAYLDGHPDLVRGFNNSGALWRSQGKYEKALDYCAKALTMQQKLTEREIKAASEAQALTTIAALYDSPGAFLSAAVHVPESAAASYAAVWEPKGAVMRLMAQRHIAAMAQAAESEATRRQFSRLAEARSQLANALHDVNLDRLVRADRLRTLSDDVDRQERELAQQLPALARIRNADKLSPGMLCARLPADSICIEFVRYFHFERDRPIGFRYLAFVLAPGREVTRIELGEAKVIDAAIASWRHDIEARQTSAAAQKLRDSIWDKLASHVPVGTGTLYLAPDGELACLPWPALPIASDRVLLDDYAVTTVPHAAFLTEQLVEKGRHRAGDRLLAAGNLDYGAALWPRLPGAAIEMDVLQRLAPAAATILAKSDVTKQRLLATLPHAQYAHLATHGFFDAKLLAVENRRSLAMPDNIAVSDAPRRRLARHPLAYCGLVLSGGEIVSGLSILDLNLNNLKLATLSACETGLGQYTGSKGVENLQMAFHIAGCPNVVASLWKVNDAATAALMAKFYHEMWVNKKPPIDALREAQLTIYRHPELIRDLAGERGAPKLREAVAVRAGAPVTGAGKHADTKLWAAFVLSGAGR